jgi:hypothetical protein
VAAGAHEVHFVVVSFLGIQGGVLWEFYGHSAPPLLDLSGKSSPISLEWHEAPATKCFHTRRYIAALQILLAISTLKAQDAKSYFP